MPDGVAEGVTHGRLFGVPTWAALLTLGGAGLVGYWLFFRNQGGGSSSDGGTTGYSTAALAVMQNPDESATMAEQNRLLSEIWTQQGEYFAELGDQVGAGFGSIGTSLSTIQGQISGIQDVQTQQGAAAQSYYQGILESLTRYANSLSAQLTEQQKQTLAGQTAILQQQLRGDAQNQVNFDQVRAGLAGLSGQMNTLSQKTDYGIALESTWFPTLRDWIQTVPYWTQNVLQGRPAQ